jgi:hypothetical protein
MADLVIKSDGTPVKKEINNLNSLQLKDGNVLDKPVIKVSALERTAIKTGINNHGESEIKINQKVPSNIGMADLVKLLNEFSGSLVQLSTSINTLSGKVDALILKSDTANTEIMREFQEYKLTMEKIIKIPKVVTCLDDKNIGCGSAKYDRGIIDVTIDIKSPSEIFLFDTSFAKIDTGITLSLDVESITVTGTIIEKENKYYLSFEKLEKYPVPNCEFRISSL